MSDDPIADKLGLQPISYDKPTIHVPAVVNNDLQPDEQLEIDHNYARENVYQTIEAGNHALESMLEIAKQSQHPRAFEVVATLMKTLVDANKELVDMSHKKSEINKPNEKEVNNTTNQIIFNGSTKELLDYIKNKG